MDAITVGMNCSDAFFDAWPEFAIDIGCLKEKQLDLCVSISDLLRTLQFVYAEIYLGKLFASSTVCP